MRQIRETNRPELERRRTIFGISGEWYRWCSASSLSAKAEAAAVSDVRGRALVIHEGGDNYSDQPENGGGKGRVACGVVPNQ
jgi:Cu/Zn superoxide dismutase